MVAQAKLVILQQKPAWLQLVPQTVLEKAVVLTDVVEAVALVLPAPPAEQRLESV